MFAARVKDTKKREATARRQQKEARRGKLAADRRRIAEERERRAAEQAADYAELCGFIGPLLLCDGVSSAIVKKRGTIEITLRGLGPSDVRALLDVLA